MSPEQMDPSMVFLNGFLAGYAAADVESPEDPAELVEDALAAFERHQEAIRQADEDVPPPP